MNLKPLNNNIIARRAEAETETDFGIVIPDTAKGKPQEGVALAVGPLVNGVKPGDRILFEKYGPTRVQHEGGDLLFLIEDDLLAIIIS